MPWVVAFGLAPSAAATSAATFPSTATSTAFLSVAALLVTATSSAAFFAAASMTSLSTTALEATASSSVKPDVPGITTGDIAVDESDSYVETAIRACYHVDGGSPMGHPSLWSSLLLCRGWSSSDDTSSSL
jgi:hypothetical protein